MSAYVKVKIDSSGSSKDASSAGSGLLQSSRAGYRALAGLSAK